MSEFDWLGTSHVGSAVVAMLSGAVVLMMKKGTRAHRRVGWVYIASMVFVNVTALLIYDLFGRFGPFHVAALLSGITVLLGTVPALRRKPKKRWIALHALWMAGSYVGLLAAAASETATRYLDMDFGLAVALATGLVVAVGVACMRIRIPKILRGYGL